MCISDFVFMHTNHQQISGPRNGKNSWFQCSLQSHETQDGHGIRVPVRLEVPRLFQSSVVQKHAIQYNRYLSYEPFSLKG